jgi:glutamate-1-semialdehyde 2,1-aminomutase
MATPTLTFAWVIPVPCLALCAQYGTLLVLDETHTLSSGVGGYTRQHGLQPDMWLAGKAVAGGLPCGLYGFTKTVGKRMQAAKHNAPEGHSGIGTTLSGNALTSTTCPGQ